MEDNNDSGELKNLRISKFVTTNSLNISDNLGGHQKDEENSEKNPQTKTSPRKKSEKMPQETKKAPSGFKIPAIVVLAATPSVMSTFSFVKVHLKVNH